MSQLSFRLLGLKSCVFKGKSHVQVIVGSAVGSTQPKQCSGDLITFEQSFAFPLSENAPPLTLRIQVFDETECIYFCDSTISTLLLTRGEQWQPLKMSSAAFADEAQNQAKVGFVVSLFNALPSREGTPTTTTTTPKAAVSPSSVHPQSSSQPEPTNVVAASSSSSDSSSVSLPLPKLSSFEHSRITLFTTSWNWNRTSKQNSTRLCMIFSGQRIPFVEVDVADERNKPLWDEALKCVQKMSSEAHLPVVFVGDEFVGGFDEIDKCNETGKLIDHLLAHGYSGPLTKLAAARVKSMSVASSVKSLPPATQVTSVLSPSSSPKLIAATVVSPSSQKIENNSPTLPAASTASVVPLPPQQLTAFPPPSSSAVAFNHHLPPLQPLFVANTPISPSDQLKPHGFPNFDMSAHHQHQHLQQLQRTPAQQFSPHTDDKLASPMCDPVPACTPPQHVPAFVASSIYGTPSALPSQPQQGSSTTDLLDSLSKMFVGSWWYIWAHDRSTAHRRFVWYSPQDETLCWSEDCNARNDSSQKKVRQVILRDCYNILSASSTESTGINFYNILVVFSNVNLLFSTQIVSKFETWFYGLTQITKEQRIRNAHLHVFSLGVPDYQ